MPEIAAPADPRNTFPGGPIMTGPFYITAAEAEAQRGQVAALRREAFAEGRDPDAVAGLVDRFDDAPNCRSYLLYCDGDAVPVGSIRACAYSARTGWRPVPAFDLYGRELADLIPPGGPFVQSTHFLVSSAARGPSLLPKLALIRCVVRQAAEEPAAWLIAVVKNVEAQLRFYARLGFGRIGPPKVHPMSGREGVLIGVRIADLVAAAAASRMLRPVIHDVACGDAAGRHVAENDSIGPRG